MRTGRIAVRTLGFLAALIALGGCEEDQIEDGVQNQLDTIWSNASNKAEVEEAVEDELQAEMRDGLVGTVVTKVPWTVYIYDIPWVTVDLGNAPLAFNAWNVRTANNGLHAYVQFDWELTWERGNGAEVRFHVDLRPSFPDHTVRIYNITGCLRGAATLRYPVREDGTSAAWVSVTESEIDLDADAEGWFWTVDVSESVKSGIDQAVLRKIAREKIKAAFGF